METCGIIAEYNPFHNGHAYQIQLVRQTLGANTGLIIGMSGDFVQRGGPAIADKWTRAEWAIEHGADLVLELPVAAATASAERFAAGGVALFSALGIVRHIAFGAETSDLAALDAIAAVLAHESDEFKVTLNDMMLEKTGFARARQKAIGQWLGANAEALLEKSNAILAISYLIAMKRRNVKFKPLLIERSGPDELDEFSDERFASASFIRQQLLKAFENHEPHRALSLLDVLPSAVLASLLQRGFSAQLNDFSKLFPHALARLISESREHLLEIDSMRPDLAMRLKNFAEERIEPTAVDSFIDQVATRVYPASRVRRALTDLYLGQWAKDQEIEDPQIIRVLAFSRRGRYLLKLMKRYASLPIVTRNSDVNELQGAARAELEASQRAADLYALLLDKNLRADFDRSVSIG